MRREFIINLALLVLLNLLVKPVYILGIDRGVQNAVGATEYGLYFALFNFAFLFQIFNDFGIQYFNNRSISQHRQLLVKYFPSMLVLKTLLGLLYGAVVIGAALLSGYTWEVFPLLLGLILLFIANSFLLYLRSNLSGLGLYRTDSVLSAVDRLLLILVVGTMLWWWPGSAHFRIEWFVGAQVVTMTSTALIAFILVRKHLPFFRLRIRKTFLLFLLRASYPYALAVFLMTLYTRVDAVMLERLLLEGDREAGIYASAYRLLDAANILGFLFAGLLLPMFARMLKTGESVVGLFRLGIKLIQLVAVPVAIGVYFFQTEIALALYTEATPYWGEVLGILMLSFILVSGVNISGPLLTANGNLRRMNQLFILGLVLNIGLNGWWIPDMGAVGAARATLLTQGLVLVGQLWLLWRILGLAIGFRLALQWLGLVVWTLGAAFAADYGLPLGWLWQLLVVLASSIPGALILGVLRPRELRQLLRRI